MVKLNLLLKAELLNVTKLRLSDDGLPWFFEIECTSCHETNDKIVGFSIQDQIESSNSRSENNFLMRCKFCKRESSASFETKDFNIPYENNGQFQRIATVECRGLEIKKWELREGYEVYGIDSNTKFEDVDLTDGEWVDYDEKSNIEVSIMEIETKIEKA